MYEVYIERAAGRDIRRLSPEESSRVLGAIGALAQNPRPPGCRKISGSVNDWRVRVGTLRIIYEIQDQASRVNVMRVRHRREAYS